MESNRKKLITACSVVVAGLAIIAGINFNKLSAEEPVIPIVPESYDYTVLELVGDASQAEFGYLVGGFEPITLSSYHNDLDAIGEIVSVTNLLEAKGHRITKYININELTEEKKIELGIDDTTQVYDQPGLFKRGENGTVRYTPTYAVDTAVVIFDSVTNKYMPCINHIDIDVNCVCDVCEEYCHKDDEPKDGICEVCEERYIPLCDTHADEDTNCVCDVCYFWYEHLDEDKDCVCDVCSKHLEHTDEDLDCKCEVCGTEAAHLDENTNCVCDKCSVQLSHDDSEADCYCDICKRPLFHDDVDGNDVCDICGETVVSSCETCVDINKDKVCDICRNDVATEGEDSEEHTTCVDENTDYVCDVCGASMEEPEEVVPPVLPAPETIYYVYAYDEATDTYTPVDVVAEEGILSTVKNYVFLSKSMIDATVDAETGLAMYILNFEIDPLGEWSFYPAYDGRRYEYVNGAFDYANAREVHSEFYTEYYFATSSKVDKGGNYAYKTTSKAYEDDSEGSYVDDVNLLNKDYFEQYVVKGKNVEVITKLYGEATVADIASADFVYVNTGQDSDILRKYWAKEHGCYVEIEGTEPTINYPGEYDALSDTSVEVISALLTKLVDQDMVIMFDDKIDFEAGSFSGLNKLYVLTNMTYPNVSNKIDLMSCNSYSEIRTLITNITGGYSLDVSLLGIDNYDLTSSVVAEHNVYAADNYSILTDFIDIPVEELPTTQEVFESISEDDYSYVPFAIVEKFDGEGNHIGDDTCVNTAVCLNYLVNYQKSSALKEKPEMTILEIEPAADFYPEEYWYLRVLGIDPYYDGSLKQTAMQSRSFQGYNTNLYDKFDIVYFGSRYQLLSHGSSSRASNDSDWRLRPSNGVDTFDCTVLGFIGTPTTIAFSSNTYYAYEDGTYSATNRGNSVGSISLRTSGSNIEITNTGYGYYSRIPVQINGSRFYLNYAHGTQGNTQHDGEFNYYTVEESKKDIGYNLTNKFANWKTTNTANTTFAVDELDSRNASYTLNGYNLTVKSDADYGVLDLKMTRYIKYAPFETAMPVTADLNGDGSNGALLYDYVLKERSNAKIELKNKWQWSSFKRVYFYETTNCTEYTKAPLPDDVTIERGDTRVSDVEYVLKRGSEIVGVISATYNSSWRTLRTSFYPFDYVLETNSNAVTTVYNDSRMNGKLYTHIGDVIKTRQPDLSWQNMTYVTNEHKSARLSGNDITIVNYNELIRFAKSGKILLFASAFFDEGGNIKASVLDETSYVAKLIRNSEIPIYNESELKNYDYSTLINTEFNINVYDIPLVYRDYSKGNWSATVDGKPGVDFGNYDLSDGGKAQYTFEELGISSASEKETAFYVDNRTVNIEFEISQLNNTLRNYTIEMYADLISDGKFDSTEKINGIIVKSGGTQVNAANLVHGQRYTVSFTVSDEFIGVVHWQLRIRPNDSTSYKSFDSYFALTTPEDAKKTLHVLQILPEGTCNFDMSTNSSFNSLLKDVNDFNIITFSMKATALVNGNGSLKEYILSPSEVRNRYTSFNSMMGTSLTYDATVGLRFHDFDMLVLGYGDYQVYATNENVLLAIHDFIDSGKSVLCTHDTLSFNYNKTKHKTFYFNTYFRSAFGQDRFGVMLHDGVVADYDKICTTDDNTFFFKHYLNSSPHNLTTFTNLMLSKYYDYSSDVAGYTIDGLEGLSDVFVIRCSNGRDDSYYVYDKDLVYNGSFSGNSFKSGNATTTKAACLNRGQITNYPYYISNDITIGETHSQYYQLALDNDEISVWFCLGESKPKTKSGILAANPLDARNNYYIYTKDNITYTGVGHKPPKPDELKLFINTLVMSYRASSKTPQLDIVNENVEEYSKNVDIYLDYDVANPDTLMDSEASDGKFRIYFNTLELFASSNVHNYIQFTDDAGNALPFTVYDLATNTPLELSDLGGSAAYELTYGPLWYFDIPISEISEMYGVSLEESYQYHFRFNLLTTYGRDNREITDYYDIFIIKRGLFNMH